MQQDCAARPCTKTVHQDGALRLHTKIEYQSFAWRLHTKIEHQDCAPRMCSKTEHQNNAPRLCMKTMLQDHVPRLHTKPFTNTVHQDHADCAPNQTPLLHIKTAPPKTEYQYHAPRLLLRPSTNTMHQDCSQDQVPIPCPKTTHQNCFRALTYLVLLCMWDSIYHFLYDQFPFSSFYHDLI